MNSSFAPSRFTRAARPLAGGSPVVVLERNPFLQVLLMLVAVRQTGRMNKSLEFFKTLALSKSQPDVRPNPSIEATATGFAPSASPFIVSAPGAKPLAAPHVKR
jgi:hypothetical protein